MTKPYLVIIDYPVRAYREYFVEAESEAEALALVKSGEFDEDCCVANDVDVDYTSPMFTVETYVETLSN